MDKKPFDLERAMAGDPIVLSNGLSAEFISYKEDAHPDRCVCLYADGNFILTNIRGVYGVGSFSVMYAFMAPKKTVWWIASWCGRYKFVRKATAAYSTMDEVKRIVEDVYKIPNYTLHQIEVEE